MVSSTNQQQQHPSLQEQLCQQIFFLPSPNCPRARVHQALDPLLEVDFSDTEDDIHRMNSDDFVEAIQRDLSGEITPLIVACDKGNRACLEYILEKFQSVEKSKDPLRLRCAKMRKLRFLLGNPLMDATSTSRNTAMHHAAMAGCSSAILLLQRIQSLLIAAEQKQFDLKVAEGEKAEEVQTSTASLFLELGSSRNAHNDTPLMMATQSPQALDFVKTWYDLALKEQKCLGGDKDLSSHLVLRRVLEAKNDSMDTCLSLACTHGRIDLVQYLTGDGENSEGGPEEWTCLAYVSADEVSKCRASFQRMSLALDSSAQLKEQYQSKRDAVEACLKHLESCLTKISERVTREILKEEERQSWLRDGKDAGNVVPEKPPRKKKKKKTPGPKEPTSSSVLDNSELPMASESIDASSDLVLTTMDDGTVAVRVKGHDLNSTSTHEDNPLWVAQCTQSLDASEMLRERFRGISSEVDSIIAALCMDVRSLLYSEHGMALNLSAAQLDAVQQILEKQLVSVQKARAIQERMHKTGGNIDNTDLY